MIRVSDYVIDRLVREGVKHVFMVSGGGAMFLIDSLGRNENIEYISNHHEQASSMSAEAYQRITGNLGVALVTTGPAGTNAITGLMCAWNDSIPVLFISGQAKSTYLIDDTGLRQRGVHEANITNIVSSITKYSEIVRNKNMIGYHLDKAIFLAKTGRPGPVWIDIPLDIQGAMIETEELVEFNPEEEYPFCSKNEDITEIDAIIDMLKEAKRPLCLAGHGVKLAKANDVFLRLVEHLNIPVVTTKNAFDLIHNSHPLHVGTIGTYGQRAANFTVQNSDFLLILGSRLAFPLVGYETQYFARDAKKVLVEVDEKQIEHALIDIDVSVNTDVTIFMEQFLSHCKEINFHGYEEWLEKIKYWKNIFPNVTIEMKEQENYVNPYHFYEVLSEEMESNDILLWDQGASFYCATVAFKVKENQQAFSNGGFTPMGYGLPAAIGACLANNKNQVICVHGDGGLQLNIQELQTIYHHQLPIKLFVFNNEGYLSIKHTQILYFNGNFVGSDPSSGLSCPDICKIADAYNIKSISIDNHTSLRKKIQSVLLSTEPIIVEVLMDPMQPIEPRVKSERLPDGKMVSKPLEDMYPYIERDTFYREMIVNTVS